MREANRQESNSIQEDLANQGDDEPEPVATISIPIVVDNIHSTYTMGIRG